MKTVTLPARKRKNSVTYTDALVTEVMEAMDKVKKGQAVAFEDDKWYDTEGKARTRAREMALLIAEKGNKVQPRTHVIPDSKGEAWTPAVSYKPAK